MRNAFAQPSAPSAPAAQPREPHESSGTRRFSTSAWSLADQSLVSLGNFGTNIFLARSLSSRSDYGTFGLVVGVMFFLNNVQGSLVNYPMQVQGASADEHGLRRFALVSLLLTLIITPALAFAIGGATIALGAGHLAPFAIAALVCWQLQETVRRALMAHLRYREVIWGDALSYLGQAGAIVYLASIHRLNLSNAFAAMAVTSILAAVLQAAQLKLTPRRGLRLLQRAREYWQLGRWMVLGNLIGLIPIQAVPWTLAIFHGPAEAAKLQAMGNLLGVTHPAIFSIGNLIVPAVARARASLGDQGAMRTALWYGTLGGLLVIPYYLALLFLPGLAIRCFYGAHSPYLDLTVALRLFAVCYMLGYVSAVLVALLNGLKASRAAFWIQLASVLTTLLVTLPLARYGGVMWGLAGGCASVSMGVLVGSVLLRQAHGRANESGRTRDAADLSPSVA